MKYFDIIKGMYQANFNYFSLLKEQRTISNFKKNKISNLYEVVHQKSIPCFVLSTGRSGTKLLTQLLKQSNQLKVVHTPQPELLWLSKYAHKHHKEKNEALQLAFDASRYEIIRNAYISNKKYIETDNHITFFAYQIAALYPKAKFIHLTRNPFSFVKSGLQRNWYDDSNIYDEGKITSTSLTWDNFNKIQKISWLWNETNSFIDTFKKTIEQERILTIKAEDLFSQPETSNTIMQFLSNNLLNLSKIKKIISKPINKQRKGSILLSEDQKKEIIKLTPLYEKYYDSFHN